MKKTAVFENILIRLMHPVVDVNDDFDNLVPLLIAAAAVASFDFIPTVKLQRKMTGKSPTKKIKQKKEAIRNNINDSRIDSVRF